MKNLHVPAICVHEPGGPEKLLLEEIAVPVPEKDQVLIKIVAAGVNPIDWKTREGLMHYPLPYIPGVEAAGVVMAVGESVFGKKVGDEVYGAIDGAYATCAVAQSELLFRKPAIWSFEEAAAAGGAKTAWGALFDVGELKKGQRILIHGAAGGVGHFAVQLAYHVGAYIIATASEANMDFVASLGANEVIDYKAVSFETAVQEVDMVLDTVGGDTTDRSLSVIKPGGVLLCLVQYPDSAKADEAGVNVAWGGTKTLVAMREAHKLLEKGLIKPYVKKVFHGLSSAAEAQEFSKYGRPGRGRIVLRVSDDR
ncbi:NADPH:quinone reductase-like Zn-dependent oxidoreductase [Chitinophaga terrae (ex Kim and Jung 2007)]|uniref:NADP-dependent oxidoreductase n=1 Tax=Chitinophaga terrae (ex Kim and Jung 2007) TaxID=408074 RepID=UPI002780F165|nr:NADP-dependent oxidoreductase [Chitinophaga terrae (ex Kim and Jung 2007)]MDQ0109465.1 NADPH:quinone reductase-like Zn-dependent oxidoreductase [Chitinophaga terrae (ex Kim and Jung 2007)]